MISHHQLKKYCISSLSANALQAANVIRKHRGIENQTHWILDVGFREYEQNADAGNIVENMSLMRKFSWRSKAYERLLPFSVLQLLSPTFYVL